MKRVIGILMVLAAGLVPGGCGSSETGDELNDAPPWGLASVDMPDTHTDVSAVLAALPDEIDGRRRSVVSPEGVMYGELGTFWIIESISSEDIRKPPWPNGHDMVTAVTIVTGM